MPAPWASLSSPVSLWGLFRFFCAATLGFGASALLLSSFGVQPRHFDCSGSLDFSYFLSAFFGASVFDGASFFPPEAASRSSAFFHNFSEVIDGHLRALCLLFRLFSASGGVGVFSGSGGVSLPSPVSITGCSGIFVVLSSAISIYLLFWDIKKGLTFLSPRGKFTLSPPRYKNTARSLAWAVLCVKLTVQLLNSPSSSSSAL